MQLGRMMIIGAICASTTACGSIHYRTAMPHPPFCVEGGSATVSTSMDDYGSIYTPGMNGPTPAAPDTRVVPATEGKECTAPPGWNYGGT